MGRVLVTRSVKFLCDDIDSPTDFTEVDVVKIIDEDGDEAIVVAVFEDEYDLDGEKRHDPEGLEESRRYAARGGRGAVDHSETEDHEVNHA